MQVCIDTLKEYGLIVEKDGKLFLKISEAEKTKRKGQRKEKEAIYNIINNINTMNKSYDHTSYFTREGNEEKRNGQPQDPLYSAEDRNCLPFAPGEETDRNTWIPLRELPEDCRRVSPAGSPDRRPSPFGFYYSGGPAFHGENFAGAEHYRKRGPSRRKRGRSAPCSATCGKAARWNRMRTSLCFYTGKTITKTRKMNRPA